MKIEPLRFRQSHLDTTARVSSPVSQGKRVGDLDGDRSINSDAEIPADVLDVVVEALVDALVLDYQQDVDAMVNSPRGKDHDCYRCVP